MLASTCIACPSLGCLPLALPRARTPLLLLSQCSSCPTCPFCGRTRASRARRSGCCRRCAHSSARSAVSSTRPARVSVCPGMLAAVHRLQVCAQSPTSVAQLLLGRPSCTAVRALQCANSQSMILPPMPPAGQLLVGVADAKHWHYSISLVTYLLIMAARSSMALATGQQAWAARGDGRLACVRTADAQAGAASLWPHSSTPLGCLQSNVD